MCLSFAVECGWGARGMIYGVAVECEDSKFKFFFVFFYVFQKAKPPQNKKGLRSGTLNRPCCFGVSSSSPENLISELFYSKERKKKKLPQLSVWLSRRQRPPIWNVFQLRCGMWVGRMWNDLRCKPPGLLGLSPGGLGYFILRFQV